MASPFCAWWRGRAEIFAKPSAFISRPTVVSLSEMPNSSQIQCARSASRHRTTSWMAGIGPRSTISARARRRASSSLGLLPGALPSSSPAGPRALKRSTQSRTVCRPTPPTRAASVREPPSRISASARSRRACAASFVPLARSARGGMDRRLPKRRGTLAEAARVGLRRLAARGRRMGHPPSPRRQARSNRRTVAERPDHRPWPDSGTRRRVGQNRARQRHHRDRGAGPDRRA